MNLNEIMSRNVQVVDPDCTLQEAARMMKDLDIGGLPVCSGDRISGFITDRDIVVRALAEGTDPATCKVSDIMSPEITWCFEDENTENAGNLMKERQVRRLLVMNHDKRLVGIVSLGDLATESEDDEFAGEVLERISEPAAQPQPSA